MNKNELNHPYTNKNGKRVNGSAAFSHYVYTSCGGVQEYNDKIGAAYIEEFVKMHSDSINKNIVRNERKRNFKVVNG